MFLKILILNFSDKDIQEISDILDKTDMYIVLIQIYLQVIEKNLRNLYLENFCQNPCKDQNPSECEDDFCAKQRISQFKKRVIFASFDLYLILKWLKQKKLMTEEETFENALTQSSASKLKYHY